MADVGINIKVTENMSSVAGNMTSSMKNVSSIAEEMKRSLNMKDLMPQYEKFADMVDKFEALRRAKREEEQDQTRKLRDVTPSAFSRKLTDVGRGLRQTGGAVQRLGAGDAAGAAEGAVGTLSGILGKAGPAGAILGIAAGGLFVVDALTKQYEKQLPVVMEVTAQLGRLSGSAENMSAQFLTTMDEIASSAAEFGMTIEEGMEVYKELLRAGSRYNVQAQSEEVMGYARGYGLERGLLARFVGTGARFGQGPNMLGLAIGGAQQAGLGPARYPEFLQSTLSIFEEGLSRGIVKGFSEINQTQVWLSQLGELFKGQTGLQMYKKMESAVIGATGLGSESDAIMFRAAKRVSDREAQKLGMGSATYIDVMKRMETGITAELFKEVKDIVVGMSANRSDQVELMRQLFGVNYTVADELLGLGGKVAAQRIAEVPKVTDTPEIRLMRAQNEIMEDIRKVGYQLVDAKMYALEGANVVVNGLTDLLGADVKSQRTRREYQEWSKSTERTEMERTVRDLQDLTPSSGMLNFLEKINVLGEPAEEISRMIREAYKAGGAEREAAVKLSDYLKEIETGSFQVKSRFAQEGGLRELANVARMTMTPEETDLFTGKGPGVHGSDVVAVLNRLVEILNKLDTDMVEEKTLEVYNMVQPGGLTQ